MIFSQDEASRCVYNRRDTCRLSYTCAQIGEAIGDYRLYDVSTGKLLAQVSGDQDTEALKPDVPEWAKSLERQLHNRP